MEFIDIPYGGKKLLLNGYAYTKKAIKKNRIRWECTNRRMLDCKGAVTTSHQVSVTYLVYSVIMSLHISELSVVTARRYASAAYAIVVCLSVCLSVRVSVRPCVRHKSEFY